MRLTVGTRAEYYKYILNGCSTNLPNISMSILIPDDSTNFNLKTKADDIIHDYLYMIVSSKNVVWYFLSRIDTEYRYNRYSLRA